MSFLYFEDDEVNIMYDTINKLQICFHPIYAPNGQFSIKNSFELLRKNKDITIIVDKNIVSPICEISKNGTLPNKLQLQKIAFFVIWTKYLNARVTCGMGILENDTAGLSTITGEENRLQFLHGVDKIPAMIWKKLAFGYQDEVPNKFLFQGKVENSKDYVLIDDLLLLCNEVAIVKIVQLIRTASLKAVDKFINFMNWYTDNLDIAESIIIYAAMAFANVPRVSLPKKVKSNNFVEVKRGVKNQAWDITYIIMWGMLYYNESKTECHMFATDDITQKLIVVNILPQGECVKAIYSIFQTKAERQKLEKLFSEKLGSSRIRPFINMEENEKVEKVKDLLNSEYSHLERMCGD